jgi:hypothetical protein
MKMKAKHKQTYGIQLKLISRSSSKTKLETSYTSSLTSQLKALEQKKKKKQPKRSRGQEIIKFWVENNQEEEEKKELFKESKKQ